MNFDTKNLGRPSTRDGSVIGILNSPAIIASGISTISSPSDPNELCDKLKLLLQEKQARNNSDISNQEIVAIVVNLLQYKCIFKKQHEQFIFEQNLSRIKKH